MRFRDREEAGQELAEAVATARAAASPGDGEPLVVLALPRGGVPVAAPVARRLDAPLDVSLVRKLGVPGNADLAMGAVAGGGVRVLNEGIVRELDIPDTWIEQEVRAQTEELERRERRYRPDASAPAVEGRTVILVDDGIATGATVRAAIRGVRAQGAARVWVATPTAASESVRMLEEEVDEVVVLYVPEPFRAVAVWYESFPQVQDDEVVRLLDEVREERRRAGPRPPSE